MAGREVTDAAVEAARRDLRETEHRLVAWGELAGMDHQVIASEGDIWSVAETAIKEHAIDLVVMGVGAQRTEKDRMRGGISALQPSRAQLSQALSNADLATN